MPKTIPIIFALLSIAHCAAADRAKLPDLSIPGAQGVNIHFTDPKPGEMKMLADAGFKWVRMDFAWGGIEREKGKYDFSAYDHLLETLKPHGIRPIFILDYANRLYDGGLSPHTDEGRAAMAAFATAAVTHFKDKGIVWEMWNEPNIKQFWKPTPSADGYAKLALAVGKAIRATAPDELFVGPATSTIDLKFLETCFKAGCLRYWDAVSVHPYRQKDPETAGAEFRTLRLLIAKYAPAEKKIPILSGEWGYSSAWKNFDEEKQAKYLPREFLVNLYNEIPISIWYDWHDDGIDPKEGEHHFGTVHNAYTIDAQAVYDPKPAYVAMKTLTQTLAGFQYNKRLAMERPEDWVLLFNKGNDLKLAVWTTSKTPHEVTIPSSAGQFTVIRSSGEKAADAQADAKGLRLKLDDSVQYLLPETKNELLQIGAAWSRVPLEFVDDEFQNPGGNNPLSHPITLKGVAENITIKPGGSLAPYFFGVSSHFGSRSPEIIMSSVSLDVIGMGILRQPTAQCSTRPLIVTLLPPADGQLTVRIENPSATPFTGILRLTALSKLAVFNPEAELRLGRVYETSLRFPLSRAMETTWSAGIRIENDKQIALKLPPQTFTLIEPLSPGSDINQSIRVIADGDKDVRSTQSLQSAPAPAKTLSGDASAIKLTYTFDPGWRFIELKPATEMLKKIPGKPKELALWLYGDNSNHALRLRFIDSTGQTFQPTGPTIDFKGWKYLTIPMTGADLAHWGKGDGQIHYPIHWDSLLLLDNTSREKSAGEIWVTGMTLVE
jgi:hypothetical protein